MKTKKTPMRMCVGCRESRDKRDLIRVVRSPDGEVSLDPTGKKPGDQTQAAGKTAGDYADGGSQPGPATGYGTGSGG